MWKKLLSGAFLLALLGLLGGCTGGGAFDETADTTQTTTTVDPIFTPLPVAKIEFVGQAIVSDGQSTTLTVKTLDANDNPVGNAPLSFSSNGILDQLPTQTNFTGQATFQLSSAQSGPVSVTVGSVDVTATHTVHFGARVSTELVKNNVLANGSDAAKLLVRVMDYQNLPISNITVNFAFSAGSFAVSTLAKDTVTDFNGMVQASITDSIAERVQVTPVVGGGTQTPVLVSFVATTLADPYSLTLTPIKQTAIANNTDAASLLVVARDAAGTPIVGVPVQLTVSSGSAVVTPPLASTDSSGSFTINVTDPVIENVTLSASSGSLRSETQTLFFIAQPTEEEAAAKPSITSVRIDVHPNNRSIVADGSDSATLAVYAMNSLGVPAAGIDAYIRLSGGAATLNPLSGTTDASGRFLTTISNRFVESVQVTGVVGGVLSESKFVSFIASPENQDTRQVGSISLVINHAEPYVTTPDLATEDQAKAVSTITAIVKDKEGVPFSGKTVEFITDSSSAILSEGAKETSGGGTASITMTNTIEQTVNIYARIDTTRSVSQPINFKFKTGPSVKTVDAVINPNNQFANGSDAAKLTVIARDQDGLPVSGAQVKLFFSSGSAVPAQSIGLTNEGGAFLTDITDTIPETFLVTAKVEGVSKDAQVTFIAEEGSESVRPVTINTLVNKPTAYLNAPPEERIEVTVIPRDLRNVPLNDVTVELASSSDTMTSEPVMITTENGVAKFVINNTVPESVTITPYANQIKGESVTVAFSQNFAKEPDTLTTSITNNNAEVEVNGTRSTITVTLLAFKDGLPLKDANAKLEVLTPDGLLPQAELSGPTDANGQFTRAFQADRAGSYRLRPSAGSKVGNEITITFIATGTAAAQDLQAFDSINFIDPPSQDIKPDGSDSAHIRVFAKRKSGQPMEGVSIQLSSTSTTAKIATPQGTTGANGVFETTMTNVVSEKVKLTAFSPQNNTSTQIDINFASETGSTTVLPPADANLDVLLSSPALDSAGDQVGIIVTARIKTVTNNPFANATVRFSADSGDIQAITVNGASELPGQTTAAGIAQARLTTVGNPLNRTIKVTAQSGPLSDSATVEVSGTNVSINGPENITVNSTQTYTVFVKDSAGNGVSNQVLNITSQSANSISNASPRTDASGRAQVEVTFNTGQDNDVLTATLVPDAKYAAVVKAMTGSIKLTVSQDSFVLEPNDACKQFPSSSGDIDVPLGQTCVFTLTWQNGTPPRAVGMSPITLSLTRGILVDSTGNPLGTNTLTTGRTDGKITFGVSADNAGPATLTAKTSVDGGPSASYSFFFVSTNAQSIDLQANPASLGVNQPGSQAEQSEIIAIVRDAKNNLVKNKRVEFLLTDVTGGKISPASAVTDQFGRATTVYTAGASSSSAGGVIISAKVGTIPAVQVSLTVAQRGVFVALGTGDTLKADAINDTRYVMPYSVLVTDINGAAVSDAEVILSLYPLSYQKGFHKWHEVSKVWVKSNTTNDPVYGTSCPNEDLISGNSAFYLNGILDSGEDINANGRMEPGNIANVEPGTVKTDASGYATFEIVYAKENAHWVDVELTARVVAAGTEDTDKTRFNLPGISEDYIIQTDPPPGVRSPFGVGGTLDDVFNPVGIFGGLCSNTN